MSLVVAIKEKDRVIIGSDSQLLRTSSNTLIFNKNNFKVWKVPGVENCVMGAVGPINALQCVRNISNLVRERDVFYDRINFEFVIKRIVPVLRDCLRDNNFIPKGTFDSFDNRFAFAYKDKLWIIHYDGTVIEVEDFASLGSGEDEAIGSLITTSKCDDSEKRIVNAIKSSAAHDIFTEYPIVIMDTKDTEYHVINKEEADKISKSK